jgi:mRNA interferase HigB
VEHICTRSRPKSQPGGYPPRKNEMHIISKTVIKQFSAIHSEADQKLNVWFRAMEHNSAKNFNELKQTFPTADYVPKKFTVFNVGGNAYRVVTVIHYNTQRVYIRGVFTHAEYDKWTKDNRGK